MNINILAEKLQEFFMGFNKYFSPFHKLLTQKILNLVQDYRMLAYEFYWRDEKEKIHFIGILPERRKKPERITKKSILNWGWKVIGDSSNVKDIYFVKVDF